MTKPRTGLSAVEQKTTSDDGFIYPVGIPEHDLAEVGAERDALVFVIENRGPSIARNVSTLCPQALSASAARHAQYRVSSTLRSTVAGVTVRRKRAIAAGFLSPMLVVGAIASGALAPSAVDDEPPATAVVAAGGRMDAEGAVNYLKVLFPGRLNHAKPTVRCGSTIDGCLSQIVTDEVTVTEFADQYFAAARVARGVAGDWRLAGRFTLSWPTGGSGFERDELLAALRDRAE